MEGSSALTAGQQEHSAPLNLKRGNERCPTYEQPGGACKRAPSLWLQQAMCCSASLPQQNFVDNECKPVCFSPTVLLRRQLRNATSNARLYGSGIFHRFATSAELHVPQLSGMARVETPWYNNATAHFATSGASELHEYWYSVYVEGFVSGLYSTIYETVLPVAEKTYLFKKLYIANHNKEP